MTPYHHATVVEALVRYKPRLVSCSGGFTRSAGQFETGKVKEGV